MSKKIYIGAYDTSGEHCLNNNNDAMNVPKEAKKVYVGVNGVPKEAKKIYIGVNGTPKLCYETTTT